MELRKKYTENPFAPQLFYIEPPKIANFKLLGQEIGIVDERTNFLNTLAKKFSQTNT